MRRVTVDTNTFISAVFWRGIPALVIMVFQKQEATLVLSESILSELQYKLYHKKFASKLIETGLTVDEIVSGIRDLAEIVQPADVPDDAVRDAKDRPILACAVGGRADCIVSGDKDLTILEVFRGIPIFTPAQFLLLDPPDVRAANDLVKD